MSNYQILLRNFPGNHFFNQKGQPKSLAFSPDIIPQYGNTPSVSDLIDDTAFGNFVGMPLVSQDDNYIFVRGVTSPDTANYFKSAITLRAIPNELILWPQVWNEVDPLESGPVVIQGGQVHWFERVAATTPFKFRPSYNGGMGYALIAHHPTLPADFDNTKRLRDCIPAPPGNITNCADYYKFITTDTSTTYYNVLVADPTLPVISVTTRLRIFDAPNADISLVFVVSHSGISTDTQVSLASDGGQIQIPLGPIESAQTKVILKAGYDGFLTMNIIAPKSQFDPYSWISLRVAQLLPSTSPLCLGAHNIIFDPDATRNIRFASPAAVNARNAQATPTAANGTGNNGQATAPTQSAPALGPLVPTIPQATGWWFRDRLGDVNFFPRSTAGPLSESPDIEPAGHEVVSPSLFKNPDADYTTDHQIELSSDDHNYVYVRGHSTEPDIVTESRLFLVKSSALIHPSTYSQDSVKDNNGEIAIRTLTTTGNGFYVFDQPFDLHSVSDPGSGDHYCLIAEVRQRRVGSWDDPSWPHEEHQEFATINDLAAWVAGDCRVCWRNIGWVPSSPHIIICVKIIIPIDAPSSTIWIIFVECFNAPPTSCWQLSCKGPDVPGLTIGWDKRPVGGSNSVWGCHFTGLPPGYQGTLQFEWTSEGQPIPSGLHFKYHLGKTMTKNLSPAASLAQSPIPGNENWPFYVGKNYPNIAGTNDTPLVPQFNKIGLNTWPYANAKFNSTGSNTWIVKS